MGNILKKINDEDFYNAVEMSAKSYSYKELIELIKSSDIVKKQIAILNLTEIKTEEDAFLLSSMLTGQDGKIREVTAYKLNELALNPLYSSFFNKYNNFEIFMNGFMDINGNICRMIVNLIQITDFKTFLSEKLPQRINSIIEEIKPMDLKSKQYLLSKKNFQLYWNLEALFYAAELIDFQVIRDILIFGSNFVDYTIREKTAKILSKYNCKDSEILKNNLLKDENYYVKRCLSNECACSSVE